MFRNGLKLKQHFHTQLARHLLSNARIYLCCLWENWEHIFPVQTHPSAERLGGGGFPTGRPPLNNDVSSLKEAKTLVMSYLEGVGDGFWPCALVEICEKCAGDGDKLWLSAAGRRLYLV